jgi:hypothetical protein
VRDSRCVVLCQPSSDQALARRGALPAHGGNRLAAPQVFVRAAPGQADGLVEYSALKPRNLRGDCAPTGSGADSPTVLPRHVSSHCSDYSANGVA